MFKSEQKKKDHSPSIRNTMTQQQYSTTIPQVKGTANLQMQPDPPEVPWLKQMFT